MKPLSKTMERVLTRMANGWELGTAMTMRGRVWLQQGGCGRGGKSETVSSATLSALENRQLISVRERAFPTARWQLTDAGKAAAEAAGGSYDG